MALDFKGGPFKGRNSFFKDTRRRMSFYCLLFLLFLLSHIQASSTSLAACTCVSSFWMNCCCHRTGPECLAVEEVRPWLTKTQKEVLLTVSLLPG